MLKKRCSEQLYNDTLSKETWLLVLDAAYKYDLEGLKEKCAKQLSDDYLTMENSLQVLDTACKYDLKELKQKCLQYLHQRESGSPYSSNRR